MKDRFSLTDIFIERLFKLDKNIRSLVTKVMFLLERNIHHPSLNVEKIYDSIYTARVDQNYRLVFQPLLEIIRLLYVGKHDDAYQFINKHKQSQIILVKEKAAPYKASKPKLLQYIDCGTISVYKFRKLINNNGQYTGKIQINKFGNIQNIVFERKSNRKKSLSKKIK